MEIAERDHIQDVVLHHLGKAMQELGLSPDTSAVILLQHPESGLTLTNIPRTAAADVLWAAYRKAAEQLNA